MIFALADVVNLASIRGAVRAVGSHLKDQGLNLLVNNAGVSLHTTLRSLDSQEMLSAFATNVVRPLLVAKVHVDLLGFSCLGRCSLRQRCPQPHGFLLSHMMGARPGPWLSPACQRSREAERWLSPAQHLLCFAPPQLELLPVPGWLRQLTPSPRKGKAGARPIPGASSPSPALLPGGLSCCSPMVCDRDLQGGPRAQGWSRINRAWLSLCQEFLPLLEKAAKGAGKRGLSCSRAAVISVSTKLGSIGLCLGVPEAPMYPYHASKVRGQGRCGGCSAVPRARGGEPVEGSPWGTHLPQATQPLPASPKREHGERDQQHPGLSLPGGCADASPRGRGPLPTSTALFWLANASPGPESRWHGGASSRLPRTW